MKTNYGDISPGTAAWATKEMLRIAEPIFSKFGQRADPVDPALRICQEDIRRELSNFRSLDGRWQPLMSERQKSLQAECALIGHVWRVQAVQYGNDKGLPACLFCGALDKP